MNTREFDKLCDLLFGDVYRFLYHLCGHRQTAEDLTQETFLRAHRYRSSLRTDRAPTPWLFKIAHNVYRDWLKKNSLYVSLETESEIDADSIPAPEEGYFDRFEDQDIYTVLHSLPDELREVIVMRDIQELSYKEIAAVLDYPIGTVMSRLHRGRNLMEKKLRERFRSQEEAEKAKNLIRFRKS